MVLQGELIKPTKVCTETKRAVLFLDEENGSTMGRGRSPYEAESKMLIDELAKGLELGRREGVNPAGRRLGTRLEFNFKVIRAVRGKCLGFGLTEDVSKVVILFKNTGEVGWRMVRVRSLSREGRQRECKTLGARQLASLRKRSSVHKGN